MLSDAIQRRKAERALRNMHSQPVRTSPETIDSSAEAQVIRPSAPVPPPTLRIVDWFIVAAAICALAWLCVVCSARRAFWTDEIFSWMMVSDPSLAHMMHSVAHAADGGGPLYYLLAWPWAHLFGSSELSLRLFSTFGFIVALAVMWCTLRRSHGVRATAFGTLTTFCTSPLLLAQVAEARFYGLMTALAALAVAAFAATANAKTISRKVIVWTALAHASLTLSHILGILYSGLVLAALLVWDTLHHRWRPRAYVAIAASWTALLLWVKPFMRLAELGKPRGWIPMPTLSSLLSMYDLQSWLWPALLLTLIALATLSHRGVSAPETLPCQTRDERTGLVLVGFLIVQTPAVLYVISHIAQPLLIQRYLAPASVGFAILLTQLASMLEVRVEVDTISGVVCAVWVLLIIGLLVYPVVHAHRSSPRDAANTAVEALVPHGVPIVVEDIHSFFPLLFYTRQQGRPYYFALDWPLAISPQGSRDAPYVYKQLKVWKDLGYWSDRLTESNELLCSCSEFAVIDSPRLPWFEERIAARPDFEYQRMGSLREGTVWLVRWEKGAKPGFCR